MDPAVFLYNGKRHPVQLSAEVSQFLTSLAVQRKVAASTQNQALSAILCLNEIVVPAGKGSRDRVTMLPALVKEPLARHLATISEPVQELLGHRDVSTTMIYTHVLNRGGRGVLSPADRP